MVAFLLLGGFFVWSWLLISSYLFHFLRPQGNCRATAIACALAGVASTSILTGLLAAIFGV